jgi:hypothetical protein
MLQIAEHDSEYGTNNVSIFVERKGREHQNCSHVAPEVEDGAAQSRRRPVSNKFGEWSG